MRGITTLHKNALLGTEVGRTLYLALLTSPPPRGGGAFIEAAFSGYARAVVAPASWSPPENGTVRTKVAISFAPALAGTTTTIVGWVLLTEPVGGVPTWYGGMTPRVIDAADPVFTVAAGALSLSFADLT